jgi:hypothetical protein
MILCDASISDNDAMSENLEINHIVPVINNVQVNQNPSLQNVNQSVDDSSVINDVVLNNVEEIDKNPSIIENTNILNPKLDTSNSRLIEELDSQNVNKVVEDLAEQFNREENTEILSDKSLELPTNQNTNVNPKTIENLHNAPDLENTMLEPT